jgi:hypothetical protein
MSIPEQLWYTREMSLMLALSLPLPLQKPFEAKHDMND